MTATKESRQMPIVSSENTQGQKHGYINALPCTHYRNGKRDKTVGLRVSHWFYSKPCEILADGGSPLSVYNNK